MTGYFHNALICLNGHLIDSQIEMNRQKRTRFCPACGERTIDKCLYCGTTIHGEYEDTAFHFDFGREVEVDVPFYCHACGKPYPWTLGYKEAAKKMVDELPRLRRKDRALLKESIDDLIDNTTNAEVTAMRFKRLTAKSNSARGKELQEFVVGIVGGVMGEATKRMMSP